jgi:tetratricopeptide (TPR) repeat protein
MVLGSFKVSSSKFLGFVGTFLVCGILACAFPPSPGQMGRSFSPDFLHHDSLAIATTLDFGLSEFMSGRMERSEIAIEQAFFATPQNHRTSLAHSLAVVYARRGAFDESLAIYRNLRAELPESISLMFEEANVLISAGRYDEGFLLYDNMLVESLNRKDFGLAVTVARLQAASYFHVGRFTEARCASSLAHNLQIQQNAQGGVEDLIIHARLLVAVGAYDEALRTISAMFSPPQYGTNPQLLHLASLAFFGKGDFLAAVELGSRALQIGYNDNLQQGAMNLILLKFAPGSEITSKIEDDEKQRLIRDILPKLLEEPIPIEVIEALRELTKT